MLDDKNILISLDSRHAKNILSGVKQVELRRRQMLIERGTTIWLYVKIPVGAIVGYATVRDVLRGSPKTLWRRFGAVSGLSRSEFFDYFSDVEQGVALLLENVEKLNGGISLTEIRQLESKFQPPQFFARLDPHHPILGAFAQLRLAGAA